MDLTPPAPALAGAAGRLAWTAPVLTEHTLFSVLSGTGVKAIAATMGLLQIGITCNGNPITCHPTG
jgi:hypothetical protein